MDWTTLVEVAVAFVLLALASYSDWKTREASDLYWMIIGLVGLAFLGVQLISDGADVLYYLILIPVAVFFLDIFWERKGMFEDGINPLPLAMYGGSLVILGFLVFQFNEDIYLWKLMLIPIMFLILILLYQFDVIKGGADAKALIALAVMFPLYPILEPFPLIAVPTEYSQFVVPFPLLILFNAALMTIAVPVVMLFYNLVHRNVRFPAMFFGYPVSIEEAKSSFVWPMERLENGERKLTLFPRDSDHTAAQLDELGAAGAKEVWVTPKIPFLIPITVSLVFSVVVGNILFLFIH